jgi:3-dehydroquinate dehydratase
MTDDLVKRYRNSREWLNDGECCGDSDGVCAAPACIFGEAVKELNNAADRIEMMSVQLLIRSDLIEKLKSEIEELKQQKYYLADKLYLATRRTDDNGDLLE